MSKKSLDHNIWRDIKNDLPPPNEFVEVIFRKGSRISNLNRKFAARFLTDGKYLWTLSGMTEEEWGEKDLGIIFWKPMSPDNKGRKTYLKTTRDNILKVYHKCPNDP